MLLEPIIALLVIRYLRITLHTKTQLPQWDKRLLAGIGAAIALLLTGIFFDDTNPVLVLTSHALVFGLAYIIFAVKEFRFARSLGYSLLPLLIISLVTDVTEMASKKIYKKWEEYFEFAIMFALLWVLAMWFINKKQRKALELERKRTADFEKEKIITEKIKAELETQIEQRTAALIQQTEELELALEELKTTQSQLVQSEKMASLGELTAGIAHEIQNPLNFINNFSELNTELIAEMEQEIKKGNMEEVKLIANDIAGNEEKILHHGQRAEVIVKGMLQHSRTSGGNKEATDINALADEYLKLAYHGLRAKNKSFNAKLKTEYDESTGNISIIPQDIGRVILNLINNAFYAVDEKKKSGVENYEPVVAVSTKKIGNIIELSVKDNGNGIPQKILDKIFQPFFTTKPTGQGTGLGLSLSYDIVKAHSGELKVETEEGKGTSFIISLPI